MIDIESVRIDVGRFLSLKFKDFPDVRVVENTSDPLVILQRKLDDCVIGFDRRGFVCHTCLYGRHSCRHVELLKALSNGLSAPEPLLQLIQDHKPEIESHERHYRRKALFTGKVSLRSEALQRSVAEGTYKDALEEFSDGRLCVIPDFAVDNCTSCGSHFKDGLEWEVGKKLFARSFIRFVDGKHFNYSRIDWALSSLQLPLPSSYVKKF